MGNFGYLALYTAAVGLGLAVCGFSLWLSRMNLTRTGRRTTGYVIDNEIRSTINRRVRFRPVVRFRTSTGQDITVIGVESRYRSFVRGTAVSVMYDPARPHRTDVGPRSTAAKLLVAGTAMIGIAAILYFIGR